MLDGPSVRLCSALHVFLLSLEVAACSRKISRRREIFALCCGCPPPLARVFHTDVHLSRWQPSAVAKTPHQEQEQHEKHDTKLRVALPMFCFEKQQGCQEESVCKEQRPSCASDHNCSWWWGASVFCRSLSGSIVHEMRLTSRGSRLRW